MQTDESRSGWTAASGTDPMINFYENTLQVVEPDRTIKFWYNRDHTFSGEDTLGNKIQGTWELRGDQICSTRTLPPPPPGQPQWTHCSKAELRQVGDRWESTGPRGDKGVLSLIPGR